MIHQFFQEISAIPRCSKNEEAIAQYLVDFAVKRNLKFIKDEHHNVVIFKPGTIEVSPVLLQAHTDMVGEKEIGSTFDFETNSIELLIKDGFYHANHTTLGADDGVGVAYMLAILDDKTLVHPPLECVFTVQEEIGLIGATLFDTTCLKSTRMIGLDASMEHVTTVSSSGGCRLEIELPILKNTQYSNVLEISIQGLSGGHSGESIHLEKANAIALAAKVLYQLQQSGLSYIGGGDKLNAIAIGCQMSVATNLDKLTCDKTLNKVLKEIQEIYPHEKNLSIQWTWMNKEEIGTDSKTCCLVSQLLNLFPYGVTHRSLEIEDLTLASANLGTIELKSDKITVGCTLRSPIVAMMNELKQKIEIICGLVGANVNYFAQYPGWNYVANSPLRTQLFETYQSLYGQPMQVEAVHGGLELGVFAHKMPGLDIVSIGPIMFDIHTPRERLDIASFERVYKLLVELLKNMVHTEGVN